MAKRKKTKNEGRNPKKEVSQGKKLLAKLLAESGPGFDTSTVKAKKPKVVPPNIEEFIRKTNERPAQQLQAAMAYRLPRPESSVQQLLRGMKTPPPNVVGKTDKEIRKEIRARVAAERSAQQYQAAMDSRLQRPESKVQQLLRGVRTPQPNVITTPDSLEGPPEPAKISQRQRRKLARDAAEEASGVKFTPGTDTIGEDYRAKYRANVDRRKKEEIIRGEVEMDEARAGARVAKRNRLRAQKQSLAPLRKLGRRLDTASWVIPLAYLGYTYGKEKIRENFNVGSKFFDGVTAVDEFLAEEKKARMLREQERKRQMKLDMLRQENIKVLRGLAPGLAASLEAGMELPEDGIMIGGRARADLLNLVADSMASGGPISMGV